MPNGIKKENLPSKVCVACGRPFTWRKKWERVWDDVTACSKSCNRQRKVTKLNERKCSFSTSTSTTSRNDTIGGAKATISTIIAQPEGIGRLGNNIIKNNDDGYNNDDVDNDDDDDDDNNKNDDTRNDDKNSNNDHDHDRRPPSLWKCPPNELKSSSTSSIQKNKKTTTTTTKKKVLKSEPTATEEVVVHATMDHNNQQDNMYRSTVSDDEDDDGPIDVVNNDDNADDDDYEDEDRLLFLLQEHEQQPPPPSPPTSSKKFDRKAAKRVQKAERRAERMGVGTDPTAGQKLCDVCDKSVDLLIRCRYEPNQTLWKMVCGTCWTNHASGGVIDGDVHHPHYRYGGLWKNRRAQQRL
jgi:hypothetical protein